MMQRSRSLAAHLLRQCHITQPAGAVSAAGVMSPSAHAAELQCQQSRSNHTVQVILTEDHDKLGTAGDVVSVKSGHARHILHPRGKAVYATAQHRRLLQDTSTSGALATQTQGSRDQSASRSSASQEASSSGRQEQQLQDIITTLTTKTIVARQRFRRSVEEQPPVSPVGRCLISKLVAKQLHIQLPPELLIMDKPIADWGEYKVPLNLVQEDGQQAEIRVHVLKVHRT